MVDVVARLEKLEEEHAKLQEQVRAMHEVMELQREMLGHLITMATLQGEFMKEVRGILH